MKKLLFILVTFIVVLQVNSIGLEKIDLRKIKQLIVKEEQLALAYKNYILKEGKRPQASNIKSLIQILIEKNHLSQYFINKNFFNASLSFSIDNLSLISSIQKELVYKNTLNHYFSNEFRIHSQAPLSLINKIIQINLSKKEQFILNNQHQLVAQIDSLFPNNYFLDKQGVFHWYGEDKKYKFSFDEDVIISKDVKIINEDRSSSEEFINLFKNKHVLYAGQKIFHIQEDIVLEYIYLGEIHGLVKTSYLQQEISKSIIQFTRRAGGILINGDIYTWGNNGNKITGIDIDNYTTTGNYAGAHYPVITGLIRVKAKNDDSIMDEKNYFSSPLRPRFIDFFATVYHSTCGITTKGEVFCNGTTAKYRSAANFRNTNGETGASEMLYKSTFFDGSQGKKATKIFANNAIWHVLLNAKKQKDGSLSGGEIYIWGYDYSGFSGNGTAIYKTARNNDDPTKITILNRGQEVKFKDITYSLSMVYMYRKIAALSDEGDIYLWGAKYLNSKMYCEDGVRKICTPTKVTTDIKFVNINGGQHSFIAQDVDEQYYKIYQNYGYDAKVRSISSIISSYTSFDAKKDAILLSVDISSKTSGSRLLLGKGVVWVNSFNELKGDYFTVENKDDDLFKDAISSIKWKNIKVIEDDNAMCGIDIYNQMYCWGQMSHYRLASHPLLKTGNTYMIPVFNTNLYDLDKDFLVSEGGSTSSNAVLSPMTSGAWSRDDGSFFVKYPTYVGGFNYEFTFK